MSKYSRQNGASLYVRNISDRVRYEDLKRLFGKHGRIVDITVPLDYYTRDPKGFAFIEFEDPRDAEDAMRYLDRYRLHNRELEIEFARGDRKTPSEMRTREKDVRFSGDNGGPPSNGGGRGGRGGHGGRGYDGDDNGGGYRERSKRSPKSRSRSRERGGRAGGGRAEKSYSRERSYSPPARQEKSSRSRSRGMPVV